MTLSLDTNVVIDLARQRPLVRTRFLAAVASGQTLAISVVVWHELMLGVLLSADPARERARLEAVLPNLVMAQLDTADAQAAAELRSVLRPIGEEIGAYDT